MALGCWTGGFTMGIMGCRCGHTIRDVSDEHPYAASLIPDKQLHLFAISLADEVSQYIEAKVQGNQDVWLNNRFWSDYTDWDKLSDSAVIEDILFEHYGCAIMIYQCENCGRVLIQSRSNPNVYCSFAPETPDSQGLLDARAELGNDEEPVTDPA